MTALFVVLLSAALAIIVSFALSPILVALLRTLDDVLRASRRKRKALAKLQTVVINIPLDTKPKFVLAADFALACALSVAIIHISVQPRMPAVIING